MKRLTFREISERLKGLDLPQFDIVIGIAEGGVVPASLAAYKLNSDLNIISINYRDENNDPKYTEPLLLSKREPADIKGDVLLVDDASVSGKTMKTAEKLFPGCNLKTMVMKGKADYVLFPEIEDCVKWPWSRD